MICEACNTENNINRLFCLHCGKTLPTQRHSCGFINSEKDIYCGGCGMLTKVSPEGIQNLNHKQTRQGLFVGENFSEEDIKAILEEDNFQTKEKKYTLSQTEIDSMFKKS
ncbi:MAG: zinc ribbon domain-containing protein [Bacteroidota bacterium]|nr:zinc ribbon domain-containing protein [Bacteroidota bacterium]